MCGRGGHEKAYGELKSGFAFASVPSLQYAANSAWQLLSVLAFNLMRGFQVAAGSGGRPLAQRRRRPLFAFRSIDTLRYELLHRAGIVLHPDGTSDLGGGNHRGGPKTLPRDRHPTSARRLSGFIVRSRLIVVELTLM